MTTSALIRYAPAALALLLLLMAATSMGADPARLAGQQPDTSSAPVLEGATWVLTRLGEETIAFGAREAHLVFRKAEAQVVGSTGCNRLNGPYQQEHSRLRLGPLMTTRMACPGEPPIEPRFLSALERVASCKVTGRQLDLFDRDGVLLARFEGRPSRDG